MMKDLANSVSDTACRLRLAQSSFADEDRETRHAYLSDVIERALASITPDQRPRFLSELAGVFPAWDQGAATPLPVPVPAAPTLEGLVAAVLSLSPEEQEQVADRLQAAGAGGSPSPPAAGLPQGAERAGQALMQEMDLPELDIARALDLVGVLVSFVLGCDQIIWSTWRTLDPRSEIRRTGDLAVDLRKYLSGDDEGNSEAVGDGLKRLRWLIGSLIAAVGQAGHQIARERFARFSPEEIEALVGVEGGGLLTSR